MNHNRKNCIFCDDFVDSKEHVWSKWMHYLLRTTKNGKYNRRTTTRTPDGLTSTSGPLEKSGEVFNIQVRAVCKKCNNGWMSQLESQVRPFLESMIVGKVTIISPEQQLSLARWCAQKFIVMEHASNNAALTPKFDRIALKNQSKIPQYFRIYAGNHISKCKSATIRHSHTLSLSLDDPMPSLDGMDRNIQTISIIMGRLFFHLNAARINNFSIEENFVIPRIWNECRIWPNPNSKIIWPHRPFLDESGLSLMGDSLNEFIKSSKVT